MPGEPSKRAEYIYMQLEVVHRKILAGDTSGAVHTLMTLQRWVLAHVTDDFTRDPHS